jgi:hypothetical protein
VRAEQRIFKGDWLSRSTDAGSPYYAVVRRSTVEAALQLLNSSSLSPLCWTSLASQGTPAPHLLGWELGDRAHKRDRDDTSIEDATHQSRAVLRHAHSHDRDITLRIDRSSRERD